MELLTLTEYLKLFAEKTPKALTNEHSSWYILITTQYREWAFSAAENDVNMIQENNILLNNGCRIMLPSPLFLQLYFKCDTVLNAMITELFQISANNPVEKFGVSICDIWQGTTIALCEGCFLTHAEIEMTEDADIPMLAKLTISIDSFTSYNGVGIPIETNEKILNYGHGEA